MGECGHYVLYLFCSSPRYFALFSLKAFNDRAARTIRMNSRTCSMSVTNKLFGRSDGKWLNFRKINLGTNVSKHNSLPPTAKRRNFKILCWLLCKRSLSVNEIKSIVFSTRIYLQTLLSQTCIEIFMYPCFTWNILILSYYNSAVFPIFFFLYELSNQRIDILRQ